MKNTGNRNKKSESEKQLTTQNMNEYKKEK